MGNALRLLFNKCCQPSTTEHSESDPHTLGPHGVSAYTVGVTALARDLLHFEVTSQVPEGLSQHVVSSRKAQANWYRKLLKAWKETKPPPRTPEEAARLIIETLQRHQKPDVEGLLSFYGFPLPHTSVEISADFPYSLPQEVQFILNTLPVVEKAVPDGDGMTVYVSTADPRESSLVPPEVMMAAVERSRARSQRNYNHADALRQTMINLNYRVIVIENQEVLAKKYRIRLRGIDAPEFEMPYGKEAKHELAKLVRGRCLTVLVYGQDQYGRCIGDVYCNGTFAQEVMLKKGLAWHYKTYDDRPELANWEKRARAKRIGLWASSNPEEPWKWRKDRRDGRY